MSEKDEKIAEMLRRVNEMTEVVTNLTQSKAARVEGEIVTRGVSSQGQPPVGLDLASIHHDISWRKIKDLEPEKK